MPETFAQRLAELLASARVLQSDLHEAGRYAAAETMRDVILDIEDAQRDHQRDTGETADAEAQP